MEYPMDTSPPPVDRGVTCRIRMGTMDMPRPVGVGWDSMIYL